MAPAPQCLLQALDKHRPGRPGDVLLALASALRAGLVGELISEMESRGDDLHSLAQLSYRHDLGFTKLTIGEIPKLRLKVRLHIWQKAAMPHEANVHNHRFDGYSYIVHGSLENTRWKAEPSRDGAYRHYRYEPRLDSSEYTLKYVGQVRLGRLWSVKVHEGETYNFAGHDLHTTTVMSPTLLTLFVEDRSCLRSHADVFARRYPASHHRVATPALSDRAYLQVLKNVCASLLVNC